MDFISVIVPVHNERATLRACIERLEAAGLSPRCEFVVVDDGSTDGSASVLAELAERHSTVRPVYREKRAGKGSAVAAGLAEARGSIAVIHDADLEYDAADLPRVIRPILEGRADAVYGSRFAAGAERRVLYYRHAIGNRIITMISNLLTDLNLTDVETGAKAFRTDLLRNVPIRSRSFTFEIELTAKLAALGARVYEVPISYHGRSYLEGKKITWRDGIRALLASLRFALSSDLGPGGQDAPSVRAARVLRRFERSHARRLGRHLGERIAHVHPDTGAITDHLLRAERVVCLAEDASAATFLSRRYAHRPNVTVLDHQPGSTSTTETVHGERPDTILAIDGFARAAEPSAFARDIAGLLDGPGRLVVSEPRGRWLFGPLDRARGRTRRCTVSAVRRYLEDAGLSIERLETFNSPGGVAWFLWSTLARRRRIGSIARRVCESPSFVWRVLDRVMPLPGSRMVVVAKRQDRT